MRDTSAGGADELQSGPSVNMRKDATATPRRGGRLDLRPAVAVNKPANDVSESAKAQSELKPLRRLDQPVSRAQSSSLTPTNQITLAQPVQVSVPAFDNSDSDEASPPIGFRDLGRPEILAERLSKVGYQCLPFLAVQMALLFETPTGGKIRSLLLEGPSGCGKSFLAKSLAKVTGAELMCLSCYRGMPTQNLIESPSTLALANAMTGKGGHTAEELLNLGILSRAFLASQDRPIIFLVDELDKPDSAIDTFFLGPIQDARIWLESRAPIDANTDNLVIIFTKNWNRTLDEALLRRVHPIKMTYLDSTLERKILSPHCHPQLVANLVEVADRMRNSGGSYSFERPPAPEELLLAGHYVQKLLTWGMNEFSFVGRNVWAILAKSEHDRSVLEHMMRFHPDFMDPLCADPKSTPLEEIYARLGKVLLHKIAEGA